ncbi:protoplast secreted protein 2 [[Candida] jaroonii]|uniref:Protoplast secreted protein 2 n=1 Tax=[Candida] jaroonii TaxID=467808 RepID=A0ACA9Y4E2_9ASCO|nr:protoplast secreted protein 2 [[Candida] jaroonii]
MTKIAVIYYSMYGHILRSSKEIAKGIANAGGKADLFQIKETLPQSLVSQIGGIEKPSIEEIPEITPGHLTEYDGFMFGIPTRYGNLPSQWKSFWDQTGGLWANGGLHGKPFGLFVSTGTPGGGQETTAISSLSSFVHHGMIYVPLGYKNTFPLLTNLNEVHGGSPWGAGTFAGADGSRQPTELELELHRIQGEEFFKTVEKLSK